MFPRFIISFFHSLFADVAAFNLRPVSGLSSSFLFTFFSLLVFLLFIVFSHPTYAADYQWLPSTGGVSVSSPSSHCSSFFFSDKYRNIHLVRVSDTRLDCHAETKLCAGWDMPACTGGSNIVWSPINTGIHYIRSGDQCSAGTIYNPSNGECEIPSCPVGATWDPFSDPPRCTFPQDDACGSIGAHWDSSSTSCKCDSQADALVTAAGVTRCMKLRDDSCTKDSPDFKGYASRGDSAGQAICDGRASCPDGGIPGYFGAGDTMTAICYNNDPDPNSECDGQPGLQDGVEVCIPKPGKDPDFPDCSGVVGTLNGVKQCIHKPTDHPGCKKGETAGYVGAGANPQFTCVPSDYKPETCPPGQYITNAATGGFGCAKADGQQKPGEDGKVPDKATGTPGKSTATATTTKKDAAGNDAGTEETQMVLDFTDLLADAPSTDFKEELDAFGDSELDGIDTDSIVDSFGGADGAFTERDSLTELGTFIKTHTIGSSTSCGGSLPFFGYEISCEKFSTYNRIVGWMIFIYTLISIYNVIMRKSDSGV
ncbi:hypothetical protein [Pseudomonas leptonychotis]|uniref:hypothetical protein n=1 Tax=Pseudomonas leptonychotis TaxID=2448482 RepID=UPI00386DDB91